MIPEEDGRVPEVSRAIGSVEVFDEVVADDPVVGGVRRESLGVAGATRVCGVCGRSGGVLHLGVFDDAVVDTGAVGGIGGIGFDELAPISSSLTL